MKNNNIKTVLTIAGSDSSGGAGIQADIKTFSALGAYGASVICAVTAQNTKGVCDIARISAENVCAQIDAVFSDLDISAVKIGMTADADTVDAIAEALIKYKPPFIVLDPVMVSTSGSALSDTDAAERTVTKLLPLADLVTPNIPEAEYISGIKIKSTSDMTAAARIIHKKGAANVLIKGGHLDGDAADTLLCGGGTLFRYTAKRINTENTHGTGCTLSAAAAVFAAKGLCVSDAVLEAKRYLTGALENSYAVGGGHGPVNHFWNLWKQE